MGLNSDTQCFRLMEYIYRHRQVSFCTNTVLILLSRPIFYISETVFLNLVFNLGRNNPKDLRFLLCSTEFGFLSTDGRQIVTVGGHKPN